MPDKFEQYYKYLKANGADVAPDFNSFKNTLSDSNKASKYYSYLKENQFDVPDTYDSFANTFGLKKKAENLQSSGIPSRLPNEPNFLQQGQKVASGEIFKDISASVPKTTLKEAVVKDKNNNNSYLGAMWNNVVASAERLAGGAARLAQKFDTSPVSMIQESVDKAASSVTGINYEAQREKEIADKVKSFIGKARTSSSSREYEQGLAEGFDITNGIGLDDLKGLGAVLPSMLADIAIAAPTAGTSFAIQGYDDALSTIDNIPEAKNMSETTRTAFGFGGAIISGVLEKLGMDNILKSGTATKYVTAKILKETAGELAKKGVKVTAEQFEKAVANKATQMLTKTALKNTVKAGAKSALAEGVTEATQEGAMDLMKLATNQLEGKEIFDEEELKNTAASRYLNAAAMGGIFGGGLGSISSRTKNVQQHIEDEVKNAKTQEDIDNIVNEINQSVQEGVISENDAEIFKSMVDDNLSKPSSLDIENEKEVKLADIDSQIASLNKEDRLYNDNLSKLNKERNETISYYDNLSKQSQKDEETSFDDGKITPAEEIITEEVTPTQVKVGDAVQWTSQGTDQFVEPKKITSISDDGSFAFVEGSNTGIPIEELSAIKVGPTEVKQTEKIEDVLPYVVEGREKFEPVIEKIKNKEIVNENDLYEAAKVLEDLKSKTNNESLNNLINPIIDKILTYENQSKTEVSTVTQKGAVTRAGVDVRKKEVSKSIGQFEGSKATIKSPDGKTVNGYIKSEGGKYVLYNSDGNKVASIGEKQITDRDVTLPSTELVPNPITLDNNGNIKSITFQLRKVDKETGLVPDRLITIDFKDPEKALDYAIQLRAEQVGEFSDAEFEEIITQVEKEVPIKSGKEVKEEGKKAEEPKIEKEPSKEGKLAEAYKDLTRNEKRQIINSKFDELIKALKIEKICPT
jgi:ribosomal protein S20